MAIQLNKPYKIIPDKLKTYERHYQIPAANALIIPTRLLGEEVACDIRWKIDSEAHIIRHIVFIGENLMPIQPFEDEDLYTIWKHNLTHYTASVKS